MNRKEMVEARTAQLKKLTDIELVDMIVSYFHGNATMPGEKSLKDYALSLKGEFDGSVITGLLSQVRGELIETFASTLVKEVRLKNVAALNENRKNRGTEGTKASDLPMVLKDAKPIPVNAVKNIYEMEAGITGTDNIVCVRGKEGPAPLASIPDGFRKNHPGLQGMAGTVIATDYSNGRFANMSYRLLVDLGQNLAA